MAMVWIRRYPPDYDRRYRRGYGYGGYGPGNSCLRDACLLETGCCVAEALNGNCLVSGLLVLPSFATEIATVVRQPSGRGRTGRLPSAALLAAIDVYQKRVSPNRPACCRFSPSCSHYAAQAIERQGALRGGYLAVRRLLRCRPGGATGSDPLPY